MEIMWAPLASCYFWKIAGLHGKIITTSSIILDSDQDEQNQRNEDELRELRKIMMRKGHWIDQDQLIYCYRRIEELQSLICKRKVELHAACSNQRPSLPPQTGEPSKS